MKVFMIRNISSFFFFQAEDGIRDYKVTGVQTCALPIFYPWGSHENLSVQLRGEFFNIFNHTQLNATSSANTVTVSSANFGSIRAANDPRIIELGLKMSF